jgi:hypothetical protein
MYCPVCGATVAEDELIAIGNTWQPDKTQCLRCAEESARIGICDQAMALLLFLEIDQDLAVRLRQVPAFAVLEEHLRDLRKVVKAGLARLDRQSEGEQPSAEAPKPTADRYSTPDLGEVEIVRRDAGWRAVTWERDCRGKRGGALLPEHRSRGKKSPAMVAPARGARLVATVGGREIQGIARRIVRALIRSDRSGQARPGDRQAIAVDVDVRPLV